MDLVDLKIATPSDDVTKRAQQAVTMAQAYVIDCKEMADAAATDLGAIKARAAELEKQRKALKEPILAAGRAVDDFFKRPAEFLQEAERLLKKSLSAWDTEQRRLADQARKEAEARAAAERARLEAEAAEKLAAARAAEAEAAAERARQQAKIDAEMAAARAANDAAAMERARHEAAENDRRAEAQAAEAAAAADQARELAATAQMVTAPVIKQEKTAGIQYRDKWVATVTDKMALLRAVLDDKAPAGLIQIDETMLRKMAEAQKSELKLAGVQVSCEKIVAASAR